MKKVRSRDFKHAVVPSLAELTFCRGGVFMSRFISVVVDLFALVAGVLLLLLVCELAIGVSNRAGVEWKVAFLSLAGCLRFLVPFVRASVDRNGDSQSHGHDGR